MEVGNIWYTKQIVLHGRSRRWAHGIRLFDQMQEQMFVPDLITCNALVSACERGHQVEGAVQSSTG